MLIINEREINESVHDSVLSMLFKENRINHNNDNPFEESEINNLVYFIDVKSITSYKKYIKLIDYKTDGLFPTNEKNSAYLVNLKILIIKIEIVGIYLQILNYPYQKKGCIRKKVCPLVRLFF